jgi:hypothetical protein
MLGAEVANQFPCGGAESLPRQLFVVGHWARLGSFLMPNSRRSTVRAAK